MIRKTIFVLAAAALLPGAAPKDRAPDVLTRTDKWIVNYDADGCHLIGQFGGGDDLLFVRFSRYEPDDHFDLSLFGNRIDVSSPRVDIKIDFGLGAGDGRAMAGRSGRLPALNLSNVRLDGWQAKKVGETGPAISPEQEAAVHGATVDLKGKRAFRLEFGSLAKPFAQMRDCMTGLVRSWGYDPQVQATLTRTPTPIDSPAQWVRGVDYPRASLAAGHNGMVQFRLDVDPEGKVAGCYVLARTDPDEFADLTCRVLSRQARLQPALDAQGKPVRSFYVSKMNWIVP